MIRPDLGAYLAVVSAGRGANVARLTALAGDATWYVPSDQPAAYREAGAPRVVPSGALCASRNAALADAWAAGLPCLQLSDDLHGLAFATPDRQRAPTGIGDVALALREALLATGAKLAGVAPTPNPFFCSPEAPLGLRHFCVGDCILVAPSAPRFDERLRLKEDYDFTLQHLAAYGRVARRNDVLLEFAHRTNPGGAVDVRTDDLERATIAYLVAKWPGCLRANPKRRNEVLLGWPPKRKGATA